MSRDRHPLILVRLLNLNTSTPTTIEEDVDNLYRQIQEGCHRPVIARDIYPENQFELFNNLPVINPELESHPNVKYMIFGRTPRDNHFLEPVITPGVMELGVPTYIESQRVIFISGRDTYETSDRITDYYQEYIRLRAYNYNRFSDVNVSPDYIWNSRRYANILREWLTSAVESYRVSQPVGKIDFNDINVKRAIMQAMFDRKIHVSQYRVTWVMGIISYFRRFIDIESMLDPFAGWGDRLIGAIKMGIIYEGYDPNRRLQPGYQAMINDLAEDKTKYSVTPLPFEVVGGFKLEFDIVFSSPPYGRTEIYDPGSQDQSTYKYRTDDEWFNNFYYPSLHKSWNVIRPGGLMILQIGDTKTFKMVEKTIEFFKRLEGCMSWGQFVTLAQVGKYPNLHLVYRKEGRGDKDSI